MERRKESGATNEHTRESNGKLAQVLIEKTSERSHTAPARKRGSAKPPADSGAPCAPELHSAERCGLLRPARRAGEERQVQAHDAHLHSHPARIGAVLTVGDRLDMVNEQALVKKQCAEDDL
jgi:hypothetical protein